MWNKINEKEWVNTIPVSPINQPETIIPTGDCRVLESQKALFKTAAVNE